MTGLSIYEATREELQETVTELDDSAVVDYLLNNPAFFIRNARLVEQMRVPHPVRGTVSLVEWHMARARNHINQLEENMTLLMEQANNNESLFYRLLHLQARLASAHSLDEFLSRFHRWARELGLAGATLRLFPRPLAHWCTVWFHPSGTEPSGV